VVLATMLGRSGESDSNSLSSNRVVTRNPPRAYTRRIFSIFLARFLAVLTR
jgi:hypothetical protein